MMRKLIWIVLLVAAGCASGIATGAQPETYKVNAPEGWRKINTPKYFMITKDGAFLQYALIQERPIDKPFLYTKKTLRPGMLPQEVASIVVDELSTDRTIIKFEMIENAPASIKGNEGFKLIFTYKHRDGSSFKTKYYGFIRGGVYYNLRYTAAQRHYFDKDEKTFDRFIETFRIVTP
jgi:hypothetical protein